MQCRQCSDVSNFLSQVPAILEDFGRVGGGYSESPTQSEHSLTCRDADLHRLVSLRQREKRAASALPMPHSFSSVPEPGPFRCAPMPEGGQPRFARVLPVMREERRLRIEFIATCRFEHMGDASVQPLAPVL